MFWTYILQNANGQFYVGQTDNLEIRLANALREVDNLSFVT